MPINFKTKNLELTPAIKSYAEEKLQNLGRHMRTEPTNIDLELEHLSTHQSGPVFRCEINCSIPGEKTLLRAESIQNDMYAAIDTCIPKIKEQLDKEREKKETLAKKGGRKFKEMMRRLFE